MDPSDIQQVIIGSGAGPDSQFIVTDRTTELPTGNYLSGYVDEDRDGNIYTVSNFDRTGGSTLTIFDSNGGVIGRYAPSAGGATGQAVPIIWTGLAACKTENAAWLTGYWDNDSPSYGGFVYKISSSGSLLISKQYPQVGGTSGAASWPGRLWGHGCTTDFSGNLYLTRNSVAGDFIDPEDDFSYITSEKLDSSGNSQWIRSSVLNSGVAAGTQVRRNMFDSSGNMYYINRWDQTTIFKVDNNFTTLIWSKAMSSLSQLYDLFVDSSDNIYALGRNSLYEMRIIKLDSSGNVLASYAHEVSDGGVGGKAGTLTGSIVYNGSYVCVLYYFNQNNLTGYGSRRWIYAKFDKDLTTCIETRQLSGANNTADWVGGSDSWKPNGEMIVTRKNSLVLSFMTGLYPSIWKFNPNSMTQTGNYSITSNTGNTSLTLSALTVTMTTNATYTQTTSNNTMNVSYFVEGIVIGANTLNCNVNSSSLPSIGSNTTFVW